MLGRKLERDGVGLHVVAAVEVSVVAITATAGAVTISLPGEPLGHVNDDGMQCLAVQVDRFFKVEGLG